ncbi:hypothetical protein B296_00004949 [Ensete ventricosum]|uniref:lipoyl(octanoyl) transferase n=1 Tax=Ensete ventricosum TaxID=4639 RepID=A0A426ZID7_ENSVE|nr:hypothetical protein B296_00004949 [Ensete ventricosum]
MEAWSWQKSLVRMRHDLVGRDEDHSDMLVILQHHPVYTLGTGSLEKYLHFNIQDAPYEIYRTERGGEVTYHGPGQLVMYPIVNLRYHKMDLHWYLRSLEEVIIRVLSSTFAIKASRIKGLTGVWVGNKKVAAIGIRVSRWITYHGLAVNVTTDLAPFQHIVPCGLQDHEIDLLISLFLMIDWNYQSKNLSWGILSQCCRQPFGNAMSLNSSTFYYNSGRYLTQKDFILKNIPIHIEFSLCFTCAEELW